MDRITRRRYSLEQYHADLAALDARRAEAPGLRVELARQLTEDADMAPVSGVVHRPTLPGGLLAPTDAPALPPASEACLRAAGLSARPSGRVR